MSRTPMIHMIGNAHLDPAWMWQMSEGLEAFLATCRSALDRMEEYPDFIFTCSSASHLEFVEQTDPALFKRIQSRAREGRWVNVGGWWVEADCNLPSGESFIRQALLGQRFFKSRFGEICNVGYCIDSFGHNANLPHLLRICGLQNFVFMRPDEAEKQLPATLVSWLSPSGDGLTTYRIPLHYSSFAKSVKEKLSALIELPQFTSEHDWMIFYGVGNHGGGPTKEQIEQILSAQQNSNNVVFSSPEQFFNSAPTSIPSISGDVHPHAIGCYSAHSELKQLNRRAEHALMSAEKICILAEHHTEYNANWAAITQGWKNVCFNQFHDILGGVSIKEACEEAINMYREAISIADREKRLALQSLAAQINTRGKGEAIIVFNPKSFDSEENFAIDLWHPHASERNEPLEQLRVTDTSGKEYIVQKSRPSGKIGGDRARFVSRAMIPALGWKVFFLQRHEKCTVGEMMTFGKGKIGALEVPLNPKWESKWLDGVHRYRPAEVYHDNSDTWGHHIRGFTELAGEFKVVKHDEIERGALHKVSRITSTYINSTLIEEYTIDYRCGMMDVAVTLDWREPNAVCKLRFDHGCKDTQATYEIPYAAIPRPISTDEQPGQSWVHVRGERNGKDFGVALINDAKYSFSITESSMYLTIARSPLYAHHVPPHVLEEGERLEYLDHGVQSFKLRLVFNCPGWTKADLHNHSAQLHEPVIPHYESGHEGSMPQELRGISVSHREIDVTVVKRSEIGDGSIMRAVNRSNRLITATINLLTAIASLEIKFRPFETKTFRIMDGVCTETDAIES